MRGDHWPDFERLVEWVAALDGIFMKLPVPPVGLEHGRAVSPTGSRRRLFSYTARPPRGRPRLPVLHHLGLLQTHRASQLRRRVKLSV